MREIPSTGQRRFPLFLLLAGLFVAAGAQAAGTASGSSGSGSQATGGGKAAGPAQASGATANVEQLLKSAQPPCSTCHQLKAGVDQPGPSLAGIAQRAQKHIKDPAYKGKARDAKSYIRESIVNPNAYIVPGPTYASGGKSLMPANYGQTLTPGQVDQIVDYLMTLK